MHKATNRKSETRATRQNLTSGAFLPHAAHQRILQVSLELLAKGGWPSMAAIAAASGRRRQTVWEHFQNARFAAWFDTEMDTFMASARSKARAKFAALAMAGSVPHYVALGWSEAKRGWATAVENRAPDVSRDDEPASMVIGSMIPRPRAHAESAAAVCESLDEPNSRAQRSDHPSRVTTRTGAV